MDTNTQVDRLREVLIEEWLKYKVNEPLAPVDRRELSILVQGLSPAASAALQKIPIETVKTRRKRLYAKLNVDGADAIISTLLGASLRVLAQKEE